MNWDDLRYFLAVAHAGGLSAAARKLRANASTCGRHIDRLERLLGAKLFLRDSRGFRLTTAGEHLFNSALNFEDDIQGLQRAVMSKAMHLDGDVSLTATEAMIEWFAGCRLGTFHRLHPRITVNLIRDNRSLNLAHLEADIAIRLARPRENGLKARRIGHLGFGLYAAKSYLEQAGVPVKPGDLSRHRFIDWPKNEATSGPVGDFRKILADKVVVFRSNSPGDRLAAVKAALGIALLPISMAVDQPGVVRLLPDLRMAQLELWLLVHQDAASIPRVRTLLEYISECARSDASRLSGD